MSALTITGQQLPTGAADGKPPAQPWRAATARSTARWGRSGAVVTVSGEVDAANADRFAGHLGRYAMYCEWLVLNLSGLGFIGIDGFSALCTVHRRFSAADKNWALVPGPAVCRLLRICSPEAGLPISESVTTALAAVQQSPSLPQPRKTTAEP